jgi:hypothetical protein
MPKFVLGRDVDFFKSIARELVDDVIQNTIVLFKINMNETKVNIYGEALNKTWYPGVEVFALIDKEPEAARYEGFGLDTDQNITFKLDRWMLEEKGIYPEVGDIIHWNEGYFEIDNTNEVQMVGGQSYNNFSIVCSTFMVSKSNLNIEEKIK